MKNSYSITQKTLAWGVHTFTASGLVCGFMAILAINEKDWRTAMLWLIACLVIDGIDGTFARLFRVKEVLPYMDGKMIDYVVDFATYAIIPAYFLYATDLVPESWELALVAIILLVSALYYGKEGMVSEDMYFVGFPVMWNMVVYCMVFVFSFAPLTNAIFILFFAILHFVPIKFAYPSQGIRFKWLTLSATILFIIALVINVYYYPNPPQLSIYLAYATILYYAGLAVYNTYLER